MQQDINDVIRQLTDIGSKAYALIKNTGYEESSALMDINYTAQDPDQAGQIRVINKILSALDYNVLPLIEDLNAEIKAEGHITINEREELEINGIKLSCGSIIEVLTNNKGDSNNGFTAGSWKRTRVEHNGARYYLVGLESLDPVNVQARIKEG